MDNELFKQKLSEVAEWQIPKLKEWEIKEAKKSARGKYKRTEEELYQIEHEQAFLEIYGGVNPTAPAELIKLKCQGHDCESCGRYCENGQHTEKKLYEANNKKHWREKCVTCNKFKNPISGKFDLDPSVAAHKWNAFLRDTKGAYKTARNKALEETSVLIRSYPDTTEPL